MIKRCLIVHDDEKRTYIAEFSGVWTRLDLDRAFLTANRALPAHLKAARDKLDSERSRQKELKLNTSEEPLASEEANQEFLIKEGA